MITKEAKETVIAGSRRDEQDTGSPEVQIAVLTERIKQVTEHLKTNKKDNHSTRGLLQMVGKRKRLLEYLKREDNETYAKVMKQHKLRGQ